MNSPDTHKLFNVYSIGLDVVFIGSFHFEWNINCIIQFDGRSMQVKQSKSFRERERESEKEEEMWVSVQSTFST